MLAGVDDCLPGLVLGRIVGGRRDGLRDHLMVQVVACARLCLKQMRDVVVVVEGDGRLVLDRCGVPPLVIRLSEVEEHDGLTAVGGGDIELVGEALAVALHRHCGGLGVGAGVEILEVVEAEWLPALHTVDGLDDG